MIVSLRPKKKYPLIEYIPDFESYNDDANIHDGDTDSAAFIETYDNDIQGSLSERLYEEIDGQTTGIYFNSFLLIKYLYLFYSGRSIITTRKYSKQKDTSDCQSITYSILLYLNVFILHRSSRINS